jgi:hypothetical protein
MFRLYPVKFELKPRNNRIKTQKGDASMENNRNLLALKPDQVVDVLVKSGCRNMTLELLHSDFDAGAPRNADGTVNFIHYMAWILKEVNSNANEPDQAQAD